MPVKYDIVVTLQKRPDFDAAGHAVKARQARRMRPELAGTEADLRARFTAAQRALVSDRFIVAWPPDAARCPGVKAQRAIEFARKSKARAFFDENLAA